MVLIILLFTLLNILIANGEITNDSVFVPLRFEQAISRLYSREHYHENIKLNKIVDFKQAFAEIANMEGFGKKISLSTDECFDQFMNFTVELKNGESWALQVFDSYGKLPSGYFQGSFFWLGEYSECIKIKEPWWNGKYCYLVNEKFTPLFLPLVYGVCFPKTCSQKDIVTLVEHVIQILPNHENTTIKSKDVVCQEDKQLDSAAICTIAFVCFILVISLIGTAIDVYRVYIKNLKNENSESIINNQETEKLVKQHIETKNDSVFVKILLSFSLYSNSIKIFNTSNMEGQLECLNGIRYLSIGNALVIQPEWVSRFSFQVIANATPSVDSFFLLSGLLTSYLFMKETSKGNWLNFSFWFKYYVHRYIRCTPPLMIMILINVNLSKYYGSGPAYPANGLEPVDCKITWKCLGQTWYLANDMQFHWLSPIVLIPLAINSNSTIFGIPLRKITQLIGILISIFLIGACIVTRALIIDNHPGYEVAPDFKLVYEAPWTRMGPFVVGLMLGYLIYLNKTKRINLKIGWVLNLIFWAASISLLGIVLFGLIGDNNRHHPLTRIQHILYQSSYRVLWSIGLSYIIFACLNSQGGFINKFLSWKIWIPLARLSFSAYLIHLALIFYFIYTSEHPFHIQDFNMAMNFISVQVVSFGLAFVFSILFEIPILSLEKLIFKKKH